MGETKSNVDERTKVAPESVRTEEFPAQLADSYARLLVVAAAVLGTREGADDVVQEAALVGLRKWSTFRAGTNFTAWMAEIVRNIALNERRKTQRRRTYAADPDDLAQTLAAPTSQLGRNDLELDDWQPWFDDLVWTALQDLSEDARCCLLLRIVHQLSYAEIGETLAISAGTAMSHVHRSRAVLRKALSNTVHARIRD